MMLYQLSGVFIVLSLLGFGGGNAIIPQMFRESVTHYHWLTASQFAQFYALARMAPGPTTTISALVGYAVAGLLGAAVATAAMFVPAGIVVAAFGAFWSRLGEHPFRPIFASGMAPVVIGLIWAGSVVIATGAIGGWKPAVVAALALVLTLRTSVSVVYLILGGGVLGMLFLR
jgi:chromate transporter